MTSILDVETPGDGKVIVWAIVPTFNATTRQPFFYFMNQRAASQGADVMNSSRYPGGNNTKVGMMAGHPVSAVERRVDPRELH